MSLPPIIERELRVALRRRRPVRSRMMISAGCIGGSLLFLIAALADGSHNAGRPLHGLLCAVALYFLLKAPLLTAGIFAEERRNQTLGLLFLSGLNPAEVFASKLMSAALIACSNLLAIVPVLALPFLIGGVSFDLFLATFAALPCLLLFVISMSLLASILTRDDGAAVIVAATIGLLVCGTGPLFYYGSIHFASGTKLSPWLLRLSPAYGPWLIADNLPAASMREFWINLAVTLAWSALFLCAAALVLNLIWRENDVSERGRRWGERWRDFLHGRAGWRRALAIRWLDVNPFIWLAARDRQPVTLSWMMIGALAAVWLGCWAIWPRHWPSVTNFFLTAAILNTAVTWVIRHTAAKSLANGRHDGSYELLLTTPLQTSDIVWGELEALHEQFRPVLRAVAAMNALMLLAGLAVRSWTPAALFVYGVAWLAVVVVTLPALWNRRAGLLYMWAGLNSARPAHAVWRASGIGASGWAWFWIFFNFRNGISGLNRFPTGGPAEIFIAVFALLIFCAIGAGQSFGTYRPMEGRLMSEFREIVREPLPEPDDPRFKKWQPQERFPWGWEMAQQQLHERLARRQGIAHGRALVLAERAASNRPADDKCS